MTRSTKNKLIVTGLTVGSLLMVLLIAWATFGHKVYDELTWRYECEVGQIQYLNAESPELLEESGRLDGVKKYCDVSYDIYLEESGS